MLQEETQVPVYFTPETPELLRMYDDVASSANTDLAASAAEGEHQGAERMRLFHYCPLDKLGCLLRTTLQRLKFSKMWQMGVVVKVRVG